jgi:hypothetical protein
MKRQELIDSLNLILPGVGEGGLGGPNLVAFDKGWWIRSLNEKLSISYKFETGVEGGLPIDDLYKVINRMKGDDLALTSDEQIVQFKCGRTKLKLIKNVGDGYERMMSRIASLDLDNVKWSPAPKKLLEGLMMSLFSAEDSEIGKLAGVIISDSLVLSTDNYRISMYDMGEDIGQENIVRLKTSSVHAIVRMKRTFEFIGSSTDGTWFHLKDKDNLIFSARQLPLTDYPLSDVLSVFSQEALSTNQIYELPNDLEESIGRAELLAGIGQGELNFSTQISLKAQDGNLLVTGKKETGELEDTIPWVGELPSITVSPTFLKKMLSITRSFKVTPNKNMVLFESPNFKFLMIAKVE